VPCANANVQLPKVWGVAFDSTTTTAVKELADVEPLILISSDTQAYPARPDDPLTDTLLGWLPGAQVKLPEDVVPALLTTTEKNP
jgi:hypothetical protein